MPIAADDDVLSGQPRIADTRVGVVHVYDTVVIGDASPVEAAAMYDVSLGAVHEALAYYYNNPEEMARHRKRQEQALDELHERVTKPPVTDWTAGKI